MENNKTQLTIDDILNPSSLSDRISSLTQITDAPLLNAITKSVQNFKKLPKNQEYCLSFSGGKDSHVLLAIYVLYLKLDNKPLNLSVKFADTKLEHHSLYESIYLAKEFCESERIPFELVVGKHSYWFIQFALGYPVPNWRNRWCTGKLKVQPMTPSKKIKAISGRHLGESSDRDRKLNKTCGSDTCGEDLIKDKYDPLIHWRNCLIWDAIYHFDSSLLYKDCFNILQTQYKQAQDDRTGSLRLGCFMCPVIAISSINRNYKSKLISKNGVAVRLLLEELRDVKRILSPRTGKKGAIYIEERRKYWNLLDKDYLLSMNWIERDDIDNITKLIQSDYSYPPTYEKEWIDEQHELLKRTFK